MFEVNNNIANINGEHGKYDKKNITNSSVKYGRNAVDNYYSYLEQPIINDKLTTAPILDFGLSPNAAENNSDKIEQFLKENDDYLKAFPPLKFEYRYMPKLSKGEVDKQAVLGAAYEELGKVKEIPVRTLDAQYAINDNFTTKALDVNKDGKIDVAEYGTTLLAADMLSKSDTQDLSNIDGTINKKGFDAVLAYTQKSNLDAATKMYSNIYNTYNLGEAKNHFKPE